MAALSQQIEKVQVQALETLTDSQKRALEINEKVAEAVKDRVPAVPSPLASLLPTPAEGIKLYFDFAGKLLDTNRKFAESLVGAWATAAKPAAKPRAKAAA